MTTNTYKRRHPFGYHAANISGLKKNRKKKSNNFGSISVQFTSFRNLKQDCEDDHRADEHRVVKFRDNLQRRKTGKTGGHQQLCTVRKYALNETRRRVHQAGGAARGDAEACRDVLCDAADGDDGNGVIGRANVSQSGKQ